MSQIDKSKNVYLIFAILFSVMFVAGIPLIIMFASKSILLMVVGIIFVLFGFYGTPLLWINFGKMCSLSRIVTAVVDEHLTTNEEISKHLQIDQNSVKQMLTECINKRYITGFLYNGEKLELNEKKAPRKSLQKCFNCGGKLEDRGNEFFCPYCDSIFKK